MKMHALLFCSVLLCCGAARAGVPADAAADIGKANRDWGAAMVRGDADAVAAAYAPDAVFCSSDGKCVAGHAAILEMTKAALAKSGGIKRAMAHTTQMVEDRGYVYEWGRAEDMNAKGETRGGGYLTVWAKQPDGHWLIIRNLVLR